METAAHVDDVPSCPLCATVIPPEFASAERITAARIASHAALELATPDEPDGHTHHAKELIGFYDLSPPVKCTFPDRQVHNRGFAIVTCCGRRIRIGNCCGRNWLTNFAYLEHLERQARSHHAATDVLRKKPGEILAALEGCREFVGQAERFYHGIRTGLSGVYNEIERRKKLAPAKRREFWRRTNVDSNLAAEVFGERFVDKKARYRDLSSAQRLEIVGLEIGDERLKLAHLKNLVDAAHVAVAVADVALLDAANAVSIADANRQRAEVQKKAEAFLDLVEEARRFFYDDNLNLIVESAHDQEVGGLLPKNGSSRNGQFFFEYNGQTRRWGLSGQHVDRLT